MLINAKVNNKLWIMNFVSNCINKLFYFQWEDEKGYWIGDYSFFGDDGKARFDQETGWKFSDSASKSVGLHRRCSA